MITYLSRTVVGAAVIMMAFTHHDAGAVGPATVGNTERLAVSTVRSGAATAVTYVTVTNTGDVPQTNVPVTFAQVFAPGDVPAGAMVTGMLGGAGTPGTASGGDFIPLQVDAKATHPDGSLRHAVFTAVLPQLTKDAPQTIQLIASPNTTTAWQPVSPSDLLNAGFSGSVNVTLGGQVYTASIDQLLRGTNVKSWLAGPLVNEWMISGPLLSGTGVPHPHLSARFAIRSYTGLNKARVDVTIENDWAYQPAPHTFVYDTQVVIGGKVAFTQSNVSHYHHARWRKIFWWGIAPQAHIAHNTAYLIASKALPNYDQKVVISQAALADLQTRFSGNNALPMGPGVAQPYMPNTGGRPDIGLLPGWLSAYLLSMDSRAKNVSLGTADLAGSWSAHYCDQKTDRPISLADYPYMTVLGNPGDTYNPVTKQREAFPPCVGSCDNPNHADAAHTPAFSYLPYLVTGDYYHLEELQFWAMWDVFQTNPAYRSYAQGLIYDTNVRVQAWDMRNIAEAAYISPDNDSLKAEFNTLLSNNLDYYNSTYTNNTAANQLGAITGPNSLSYNNGLGVAPWMDDFFTSAIGHINELGYSKAAPLLAWKAKFPTGRMIAQDYCWIFGGIYTLNVKASTTSPIYSNFGDAYNASRPASVAGLTCNSPEMAKALGLKVGEMTGYSSEPTGYPSNMQPALAYGADSGASGTQAAWQKFMQRSVLPNYTAYPEFAIVPRSTTGGRSPLPAGK